MPPSPATAAALQRAVDAANAAIRTIVQGYAGGRLPAPGLRPEYDAAVEVYNAAVTTLHRAREPEDEPAAGLVLTA
jgi:hypothetical protein